MIRVISDGRLGNQLFHYAFAIAGAKALHTSFHIDFVHGKDEVAEWFEIEQAVAPLRAGRLQKWLLGQRDRWLGPTIVEDDMQQVYRGFQNGTTYKGFFQSEQYFEQVADLIKNVFRLQARWQQAFQQVAPAYDFDNSIVMHVRLGDYCTWGSPALGGTDMSLPASYYEHALQHLGASAGSPVILISDDEPAALARLSFLRQVLVFRHNAVLSFQAMLHARRLVVSNSSFAWWAAWLNPHQPQVVAPQHWLGFKVGYEHPHGIMPASFAAVPVF
ncbi:MAG: alpha-1,2-fucosyltransferase [Chitinophagaceae bacterium]|nr:alpha-1,2-fucosyltransferase [Chitinophagaceae bacterium]